MSDDALRVFYAPYCGGWARSAALRDELKLLQARRLEGCRPVADAEWNGFVLSWGDERAPLRDPVPALVPGPTGCLATLQFSNAPIVSWLMECSAFVDAEPALPDAFWYWVLLGQEDSVADA